MLQCVAGCCRVLQGVAGCSVVHSLVWHVFILCCVAVCCSMLQCVAVCCKVLQGVVWCTVSFDMFSYTAVRANKPTCTTPQHWRDLTFLLTTSLFWVSFHICTSLLTYIHILQYRQRSQRAKSKIIIPFLCLFSRSLFTCVRLFWHIFIYRSTGKQANVYYAITVIWFNVSSDHVSFHICTSLLTHFHIPQYGQTSQRVLRHNTYLI